MVDQSPEILRDYPNSVVTSQGPRSRLSPAEIAQPYEMLGKSLDSIGEGLSDIAVPLAQAQAFKAVTRDATGNIQVAPPPMIFGAAGDAYRRAVKVGALAEADGQAERADIAMRQKFRDDPQGYQAALQAFKEKQIDMMSSAAGPEVGVALGRAIDTRTTQTYRGLLGEQERLELQRSDNSIAAGVQSASDDAFALARQGVSPDDPAMKSAMDKYTSLLGERMKNPRLAYTKEQYDLDVARFQSEIGANRFLYHIDQEYQKNGPQAAEAAARDIQSNSAYKLSPEQRDSYYHKAVGEVRAQEAIRHQDIGEARAALSELEMSSAIGGTVSPDQVEHVAQAFKAAGDPGSAARVYSMFARKALNDDFIRQPFRDQIDQITNLQGGGQFLQGLEGLNRVQGAILGQESSNRDFPGTSINGAMGPGQIIPATFAQYAKPGESIGNPTDNRAVSARIVADYFQRYNGDVARVAVAYFSGPGNVAPAGSATSWKTDSTDGAGKRTSSYVSDMLRRVGQEAPNPDNSNPAGSAWLLANRQRTMNVEMWNGWKEVMKDYDEKGVYPNNEAVSRIVDGAKATGNAALLSQVSHDMTRIDFAKGELQKPLGQQTADITDLSAKGQAGQLPPGMHDVLKDLQRGNAAIAKGLEENPVQTAVTNFPDKLKTPDPIDWKNPQASILGLAQRAKIVQFAANNWRTGPLSALDKQDLVDIKGALSSPDPAVKAGIYGAIATLPDAVRAATLAKIGGGEPTGMAEAAAGSLMSERPDIGMSIFRGQMAMKTDKRYDPENEDEGKGAYKTDLDKYLPPTTFNLQSRTDTAGAYAVTTTMVKARYADLSAQAGQTSYSRDRLEQAVNDVTGGVLSRNGGNFIAPARGMTQPQFDGVLSGLNDNDLPGVLTLGGQRVTADYVRRNGQLESVGDGKYFIRLGKDPMKPIYAYSTNGGMSKFILDLRNREAPAAPLDQSPFFWNPVP